MSSLKDMILSGYLSLTKAEQAILKNVINGADDTNSTQQEEQVRKNEIKLISPKRFHEILENADKYISARDKEYLTSLMEQRNIDDIQLIFKNDKYTSFENSGLNYKFKTDNALFRFADILHVKENVDGKKLLLFFINTQEHPSVITNYDKLSTLKYFEITDNRATYSYDVVSFAGRETVSNFEIILKFTANVISDGVKPILNEEDRVFTKWDLDEFKRKTYTLGSSDFK